MYMYVPSTVKLTKKPNSTQYIICKGSYTYIIIKLSYNIVIVWLGEQQHCAVSSYAIGRWSSTIIIILSGVAVVKGDIEEVSAVGHLWSRLRTGDRFELLVQAHTHLLQDMTCILGCLEKWHNQYTQTRLHNHNIHILQFNTIIQYDVNMTTAHTTYVQHA